MKICGMRREEDVLAACEAGADYIGFVLYRESKRWIEPERVRTFVQTIRQQRLTAIPVAVTVNASYEEIIALHRETEIEWIQLHGTEPPALVERLQKSGFRVIKAVRIGPNKILPHWRDYAPDYFLCDTLDPMQLGGTGRGWKVEWLPSDFPLEKTFLAGGLNAANVASILATRRPFGVDTSSGVEIAPGVKDPAQIKLFVDTVRRASSLAERHTR